MPSTSTGSDYSNEHIQEAKDNYERYLRFLQDDRDIDWALIALFYSAVHLVQAHAERYARSAVGEVIPTNHDQRNGYASRQLAELFDDYMLLQNASRHARYDRKKRTREEVIRIHDSLFEQVRSLLAKRKINW